MLAAFCIPDAIREEERACFELRETPRPSLEGLPPGSVLIKSLAGSICGSDLCGKGGEAGWRRPTDLLYTQSGICGGPGHEVVGQVEQVVEPCAALQVGQRVLALSPVYIHKIPGIRKRFEEETGTNAADFPQQGAFAQYFCSHACTCLPLPTTTPLLADDFDPLWFVAAQPMGTIIHACKKLGSVMGLDVAIVGQGQNGLILTQLLASMGARRIIALDFFENRLECSKKFKATHTIQVSPTLDDMSTTKAVVEQITDGKMCDVVVDMAGHQNRSLDLAAQLTKSNGTVLLFGLPPARNESPMSIRSQDFYRNIRYICSHSPGMDCFQLAIEMLEQGRFDPSLLFTHRTAIHQFPEAYEMANNYKDGVVKILLTYD